MVRKGRPGLPGLLEPDLRTVSAAGDLPVPFLFHWTAEKVRTGLEPSPRGNTLGADASMHAGVRNQAPLAPK